VWLVPLRGRGKVADQALEPGGVWMVDGAASLDLAEGIEVIVAYRGSEVDESLIG
jgi:hypothetical protein